MAVLKSLPEPNPELPVARPASVDAKGTAGTLG